MIAEQLLWMCREALWLDERDISNIIAKTKDLSPQIIQFVYDRLGDQYIKYVPYVARMLKKIPVEDIASTYDSFDVPALLDLVAKERLNISMYLSLDALQKSTQDMAAKGTELKTNDGSVVVVPSQGDPEFPLVHKKGAWSVYELKTWEAAVKYTPRYRKDETGVQSDELGLNLGWCTGDPHDRSYFGTYTEEEGGSGRLFVLVRNGRIELQLSVRGDGTWDPGDEAEGDGEEGGGGEIVGGYATELQAPHNNGKSLTDLLAKEKDLGEFAEKVGIQLTPGSGMEYKGRMIRWKIEGGIVKIASVRLEHAGLEDLKEFKEKLSQSSGCEKYEVGKLFLGENKISSWEGFPDRVVGMELGDVTVTDFVRPGGWEGLKSLKVFFSGLKSMKGLPDEMKDVEITNSNLTSFEGCPSTDWMDLSDNRIASWVGAPARIKWLDVCNNRIKTLEGMPETDILRCAENQFRNFKGLKVTEEGTVYARGYSGGRPGKLVSLEGCPKTLKYLSVGNNQVKSLVGGPEKIDEMYVFRNELVNLVGMPKEFKILDVSDNQIASYEGLVRGTRAKIRRKNNPITKRAKPSE